MSMRAPRPVFFRGDYEPKSTRSDRRLVRGEAPRWRKPYDVVAAMQGRPGASFNTNVAGPHGLARVGDPRLDRGQVQSACRMNHGRRERIVGHSHATKGGI